MNFRFFVLRSERYNEMCLVNGSLTQFMQSLYSLFLERVMYG